MNFSFLSRLGCAVVVLTAQAASAANPLASAKPGEVIELSDAPALKDIPVVAAPVTPAGGPLLLFSDGPEYFPSNGIALREDVKPGSFRLYIYHCPESTGAKKTITAVVENLGDAPMKLRFRHYGYQKPGKDYLKVGKAGLLDYFSAKAGPVERTVAAHARVVLDPVMDAAVVTKDDLVHAFHELEVDQPARVSVFQRDPDQDSLKVLDALPLLERGKHGAGRGQFATTDFTVDASVDTADGPKQIVVADGKRDPWITGRDATTGPDAPARDAGNYGVVYRIKITRRSTDGRRLALLIVKPQEDKGYCPGAAAVVALGAGDAREQVIPLPKDQPKFHHYPQAVVVQTFAPLPAGKSETIELTYSPPGASCLPTPFLLVPYKP